MGGQRGVKADPSAWIPLLSDYRLTSLANDTVLQGTLRPELDAGSPLVREALEDWPAKAYLLADGDTTDVVLVYQTGESGRRWPLVHVALLAATLFTTLAAGALMAGLDPLGTRVFEVGRIALPYPSRVHWGTLLLGAPFALPFLGVLLAHEMGHYVAARIHRVRATLPYFIPFPPYFSIIGTVGAFIRLKGPTVRRSILFDVGSAGPLASFLVSLPLLFVGMSLSVPVPGRASLTSPFVIHFAGQLVWLGNGLVTHVAAVSAAPAAVGETLILLHPLALAGWLGLFVTALNLLPLGQLDGGHILYALSPDRAPWGARLFLGMLALLGFLWWGWWAWAVVVLLLHRGRVRHPNVLQREREIGRTRRVFGWILIAVFFLTFVPVPLRL